MKMKSAIIRKVISLVVTAVMLAVSSVPAFAGDISERDSARTPRVVVSGQDYSGHVKLIDGVTYVRLREFSEGLGAEVIWNGASSTARVKTSSLDLFAKIGEPGVTANGRYISSKGKIFLESDRTYVPLRIIGTAFGFETSWDNGSFTATMVRHTDAVESYAPDDLYWLSRIIHAEARGESMEGKLAVGSVVLNRVRSSEFPNTIYGVIFDRAGGVQFTPVANGEIYRTPDSESIEAAKRCLNGESVSKSILFFINASIAESFWISANRPYVMTIGNHDFYA